ncbi:dTMP kinase [Bacillus salacetis]|uniref:Thymidylate kinase n=1 Tax=Bacillus salacetis TaxID=2315464 RepID=A0A3A1QRQ6_9BACI|nr:dTMP kinase [Bacillus salacetis]RIW29890.1 dTMP kinase [Bacillus salacetis]
MEQGIFITVEGPEGAGKSTIIKQMAEELAGKGHEVVLTREPGGITIAEEIREVILNPKHTEMDERTEALLYAAARRQHLAEKVIPALENKQIVLCDRFLDSSLAYQGHARGIGMEEVYSINQFAIGNTMPDITLYFDVEPEVGLQRISKHQGREVNRLDLETLEFHERVREGYLMLLEKFPDRIKKIDAGKSFTEVYQHAFNIVEKYIAARPVK